MTPSGYLIRDLLQHVVPTLAGLALFVPLVKETVAVGLLVVAALVLGYLLGPVIGAVAGPVVRLLPGIGGAVRRHRRAYLWWSANVDFNRLWYRLPRDDRQALHAARAYGDLYATLAFHLAVYAIIAGVRFGTELGAPPAPEGLETREMALGYADWLLAPVMPILGGWDVSSLVLCLLAVVAFLFAARGYVREVGMVYGEDGHHVSLARSNHLRTGDIASGVWGRITRGGIPVREAGVSVYDIEDRKLAEVETDRRGRFQIPGLFRESFPDGQEATVRTFRLDINIDGDHRLCDVPLNRRQMPELEINLS